MYKRDIGTATQNVLYYATVTEDLRSFRDARPEQRSGANQKKEEMKTQ